jgi:hypothetical protein
LAKTRKNSQIFYFSFGDEKKTPKPVSISTDFLIKEPKIELSNICRGKFTLELFLKTKIYVVFCRQQQDFQDSPSFVTAKPPQSISPLITFKSASRTAKNIKTRDK